LNGYACPSREVTGETRQRVKQAELGQHSGAKTLGDPSNLLEAGPRGVPHLLELRGHRRCRKVYGLFEPEQNGGEALAHLIMQFLGDPLSFRFPGREGLAPC
jgi:hypothetical protein